MLIITLILLRVVDITCKLRPTAKDVVALGPRFEEVWMKEWERNGNQPMITSQAFPKSPVAQFSSRSIYTPYPFSCGHVHVTRPVLGDKLDFVSGFSSDVGDNDIKICW
ncbi:hypothetical protein GGR53DRAFT_462011 [Hypoxylon sp. FL1150]|nr:hypothetical protein GGR53DRAFT_462011 [Hypoxylon sp. FL1150]